MQTLPIYFDFKICISGPPFGAEVRIQGRATCVEEFGATWMYGVNPGSLAERGHDLQSAYEAFRQGMVEVLCDLAEVASDFENFREAARAFVATTNRASVTEWETARQAVREGGADDVELRRETGEIKPATEIEPLPGSLEAVASGPFTPLPLELPDRQTPQRVAA